MPNRDHGPLDSPSRNENSKAMRSMQKEGCRKCTTNPVELYVAKN